MNWTAAPDAIALFEFGHRFSLLEIGSGEARRWVCRDHLSPASNRTIPARCSFDQNDGATRRALFRLLMPPCVAHAPLPVETRVGGAVGGHFWQFPAITERMAWEVHAAIPVPDWERDDGRPISCYLGLPWASYIDRKAVPEVVTQVFGVRLRGYRALAAHWGWAWGREVRVHTVCQHIYWERLLPQWQSLGVTDLHLSHCDAAAAATAAKYGMTVHSWTLAAPNIVNPERGEGLDLGRPLQRRSLLASFTGAHMPHYRSDVRPRLAREAQRDGGADLAVRLGGDWHFNPLVYGVQVAGLALAPSQAAAERAATIRYNQLLSDSVFSLCPEGAGPNTLRLWESLACGTIPVFIGDDWVRPPVPGDDLGWDDAVISVGRDEVAGLFERLRELRREEPAALAAMQTAAVTLYARFLGLRCF